MNHYIHALRIGLIVKNGRTMLLGVVDSAAIDRLPKCARAR